MLYYVDTTIFNGLEALLLTHSNLQLRSCHQVTLHDIYDRWRTITSEIRFSTETVADPVTISVKWYICSIDSRRVPNTVFFLPPAYEVRREVIFLVCLFVSSHLGGTPSPSHNTSIGPLLFLGYPSGWSKVPSQGVTQSQGGGYPSPR